VKKERGNIIIILICILCREAGLLAKKKESKTRRETFKTDLCVY